MRTITKTFLLTIFCTFFTFNQLFAQTETPPTFSLKTTSDGLGGNFVYSVAAAGNQVFVGTDSGLGVSDDGGATFVNKTSMTDGLGSDFIEHISVESTEMIDVPVPGETTIEIGEILATGGGTISSSSDAVFFNTIDLPDSPIINPLAAVAGGGKIYIASQEGGLHIYEFSEETFEMVYTQKTTADGLSADFASSVFVSGNTVCVAHTNFMDPFASAGISISTDGGETFVAKTTTDGLPSNDVSDISINNGELLISTPSGLVSYYLFDTMFSPIDVDPFDFNTPVLKALSVEGITYAITPNGLFMSDEFGSTFSNILENQFLTSLAYSNGKIYAGSDVGIYVQDDEEEIIIETGPGKALAFGGGGNRVSIADAPENNFASTNKFTIEFWCKVTDDYANMVFVNKGGGLGDEQYSFDHFGQNFRFYIFGTTETSSRVDMPRLTVAEGWVHIAGSYDGGTQEMKLYKNGVEVASKDDAHPALNSNGNDLSFGVQAAPSLSAYLHGSLDEVRLWNYVRTESQINAQMNCELYFSRPGLNAYYSFNQGLGNGNNPGLTNLNDLSGNGNNGTLHSSFVLDNIYSNWVTDTPLAGDTCQIVELEELESIWSAADIITDCDSDTGTYDICYTATDLVDVIGVDFNFSYPAELTPVSNNFITLKNLCLAPVGGDSDKVEVYTNTDNVGSVLASVYFDFNAPLDADWSGSGEFICFSFELSNTWNGMGGSHIIETGDIVESYETSVDMKTAEDATLEIVTMIGQINVNGDENIPLVNGLAFNGTTEITTADENCSPDGRWTQGLNTETDGGFSIAAGGSENVRITRNTSENDLSVIGGSDALRAVFIRLGLGAAPTLNELLAMDVNGDGFASAGDITNILRRSVGLIADYPTQAGEVASDWKFALSADMDALEGGSYDWKTVPVLSQCIAVPADACDATVEYDAVLKGDIVSSWTSGSNFKTAAETSLIVDVAAKHTLEMETTYRIPVYAQDIESFFTLDLDLPFDPSKVSIQDVVLTEIGESYDIQYVWNTPEEGRLMMASYTIQEIDTNEPLFEIVVSEDITGEEFGTGTSYFNGIASLVEVVESTAVGIEDILGGSNSLTAIQNIQPNPANNIVMIEYSTAQLTGDLQVQIMDLAGRTVAVQNDENNGKAVMDISALQNGLYIVTLSEDGQLKGRAKLMVAK